MLTIDVNPDTTAQEVDSTPEAMLTSLVRGWMEQHHPGHIELTRRVIGQALSAYAGGASVFEAVSLARLDAEEALSAEGDCP